MDTPNTIEDALASMTTEAKLNYLIRLVSELHYKVQVLQASNDNLQLLIRDLKRENEASFVPVREVCGKGKLIPKDQKTVRAWMNKYGRENYHYKRCGGMILINVDRVNDLFAGRG